MSEGEHEELKNYLINLYKNVANKDITKEVDEIINKYFSCPYCGEIVDKSSNDFIFMWGLALTNSETTKMFVSNVSSLTPYYFHVDCYLPYMEGKIMEFRNPCTKEGVYPIIREGIIKNEN